MQVMRLVDPGRVDKIIAFDSLPKRLLTGIQTKGLDGFPRYWKAWLKDNGSMHKVKRWNAETQRHDDIEETFTYILNFKTVNNDTEKWQTISNYVRKAVDLKVRLMDKIEDMAIAFAKDSYSELSIEPEQVPVIPIPLEASEVQEAPRIIRPSEMKDGEQSTETVIVKKKPGRPKKIAVEA